MVKTDDVERQLFPSKHFFIARATYLRIPERRMAGPCPEPLDKAQHYIARGKNQSGRRRLLATTAAAAGPLKRGRRVQTDRIAGQQVGRWLAAAGQLVSYCCRIDADDGFILGNGRFGCR